MSEQEFIVKLENRVREDGSVIIFSSELPLFSVVGKDVHDALALMLETLPEYLRANVPEFVTLRPAPSIDSVLLGKGSPSVPTYMIAELGGGVGRRSAETVPA